MKKVKTWGKKCPAKLNPEGEAKQRQPPMEGELSLTEKQPLTERRRFVLTSRSRSELACKVYENMSQKEAGIQVSSDIASSPSVKHALYSNNYKRKKKLYDPRHITILYEHYKA